jgi:hypothetical protein
MPKKSPVLDLKQLEDLAATSMTQPEIAEALGMKFSTFTLQLKVNKETREAYDRGRAKAEENGMAPKPLRKTANAVEPESDTIQSARNPELIIEKPEDETSVFAPGNETEIISEESDIDERELITKAIRAGCNLVYSIAGCSYLTKLETQNILLEMCEENLVEWRDIGTVRAWFIRGEVPAGRLFLNGNGGVCADSTPVPEESKAAVVVSASPAKTATLPASQNGNGSKSWRENYTLPKLEKPETPKAKINRLELLKKVQTELMFYDTWGEFSPRCDELLGVLTEALNV